MSFSWVIGIVVVLNIPVYLFIGWLAFDSASKAADTFVDTIYALLKQLLVPRFVRLMLDWEDEGLGLLPILGYFIACTVVTVGQLYLIDRWFY